MGPISPLHVGLADGIFVHPKSWLNPEKCWKATHSSSINVCIYKYLHAK
jgi:hypothetical protein